MVVRLELDGRKALGSSRTASDRAYLIRLVVVDHDISGHHIPALQRLGHRIDLVVVGAVGKGCGLLDEVVHPRHELTGGYTPAPWAAGGGAQTDWPMGGGDWSGVSAGTTALNRAPGATSGFNPLAMLFGGTRGGAAGESWPSGLAGIVSSFKSTNWGSFKRSPSNPTYGTLENAGLGPLFSWESLPAGGQANTDESGNDLQTGDSGGKITGIGGVAGAALGAGGMMLASAGLLGNNRGTWGGIAEGTIGGAMIGMQMGGPLGAAIGACAGFAIGGMEMLLGIVSPAPDVISSHTKRLLEETPWPSPLHGLSQQIRDLLQSLSLFGTPGHSKPSFNDAEKGRFICRSRASRGTHNTVCADGQSTCAGSETHQVSILECSLDCTGASWNTA
jgi:hypothetical protein